jgi:hypothetical protein
MGDDERDMFKSRESLSYVRALSDHGFTDFDLSGFRERWCPFQLCVLCVPLWTPRYL